MEVDVQWRVWSCVALTLVIAGPGQAKKNKKKVIERITAEQVVEIVKDTGEIEVGTDSYGDPYVTVSGTLNYSVAFYDCVEDACEEIQLRAQFQATDGTPVPTETMFAYAWEHRTGRVYRGKSGNAVVETLIPVTGGVTLEHVRLQHGEFLRAAERLREKL